MFGAARREDVPPLRPFWRPVALVLILEGPSPPACTLLAPRRSCGASVSDHRPRRLSVVPRRGAALEPREPGLLTPSHLARLLDLARALSSEAEHEALAAIAVERVRILSGAVAARLEELEGDAMLTVVAESSAAPHATGRDREQEFTTSAPQREVVRTGAPAWIGTAASAQARFGSAPLPDLARAAGAWAFLPLRAGGRLTGTLALAFDGPRTFDDGARAFVSELASVCALALARGTLFSREHARAEASDCARTEAEARLRCSERLVRERSHLYERERFARAHAEAAAAFALDTAEALAHAQRLTTALAHARSVPAVTAAIGVLGPAAFGALGVTLLWRNTAGRYETLVAPPWGAGAGAAGERLERNGGWADAEVFRADRACWFDAADLIDRFPATAESLATVGSASWLGVPIHRGTDLCGVLSIAFGGEEVPADERGRLTLLAEECTSVLEERDPARALRRSSNDGRGPAPPPVP